MPQRLTYPELFPPEKFGELFYQTGKLESKLEDVLKNYKTVNINKISERSLSFNWHRLSNRFNSLIDELNI